MKSKKMLLPDHIFEAVLRIDPAFFADNGIRYLISDIDNTLATYAEAVPSERIRAWLDAVGETGVSVALISNNSASRVARFNGPLGFPVCSRAGKPFAGRLRRLMAGLGADPEQTCILGDQLFTDVLCAHRAGIRAVLVDSIDVAGRPFLRMRKRIEARILRKNGLK